MFPAALEAATEVIRLVAKEGVMDAKAMHLAEDDISDCTVEWLLAERAFEISKVLHLTAELQRRKVGK